jgi:hypothetical protein
MEQLQILGHLLMGTAPTPDVDWSTIVALAVRNQVAPLLFLQLKRLNDSLAGDLRDEFPVPEAVLGQLQNVYRGSVLHGMVSERELAKVLDALNEASVPVLVLKGAAVADSYPYATLRPYVDLDILVQKDQLFKAREALLSLGYQGDEAGEWVMEKHSHLPRLASDDKQLSVELHWRLDSEGAGSSLPVEDLWQRAEPWSVQDQPALRLDPVDAVLYQCNHALYRHRGAMGLRPICDVALMIKSWDPEQWQELLARALEYGSGPVLYLMLSMVKEIMGQETPQQVMAALRPPGLKELPYELIAPMLQLEAEATRVSSGLVGAWVRGSPKGRLRDFFSRLWLPRRAMEAVYGVPVGSPRIWLTYVWRPIDLVLRYGRSLVAIIRRDPGAHTTWAQQTWLEEFLEHDGAEGPARKGVGHR